MNHPSPHRSPLPDRPIVAIPSDDPPQIQGSSWLELLDKRAEIRLFTDRVAGLEEQLERVAGAHVVINSRSYLRWTDEAFARLPDLRFITTCGIGTDTLDLPSAVRWGIVISNVPGRTGAIVAEHALALMLAVAKRTSFYTAALREGRWLKQDTVLLRGKTAGIVGTGNHGARTAALCRALGMDVLAWTFRPSPERGRELGVEYVELDDLLRRADVVSLHVALSDQTRGMMGRRELGLMKEGALLINVCRGGVLDQGALVEALQSGRLGGAGLDVFETEPIPPESALLSCEHIVLTPHVADMTPEGLDRLNQGAVENALAFLDGSPQNVVNG